MNYDLSRSAKVILACIAFVILVLVANGSKAPLDPNPNVAQCMHEWIAGSAGKITNDQARNLCKRYPKISARELIER